MKRWKGQCNHFPTPFFVGTSVLCNSARTSARTSASASAAVAISFAQVGPARDATDAILFADNVLPFGGFGATIGAIRHICLQMKRMIEQISFSMFCILFSLHIKHIKNEFSLLPVSHEYYFH